MIVQFVPLLTLSVTHGFSGGAYTGLSFVLPGDTVGTLENGRLLAKVMDGRLLVLFQADDAGQPLVPLTGATLRIGLVPQDQSFGNVTAFAVDPASFVALYTNEVDTGTVGAPAPVTLVGPVFGHALQDAARPATVTLSNAGGAVLETEQVTAGDGRTAVSFDLLGLPRGQLTLTEVYPGNVQKVTAYYLDAELRAEAVFAIVEVCLDAGFYAAPADLEIAFDAKQDTLKYYVVARNYSDADLAQLAVADAGFAEESRPQVTFTRVPAASFTAAEIPAALLAGTDGKVVLFKSQAPIARRAGGRKKVQLKKNGEVLVQHLPHPAPESASADRIVHVSKP